MIQPLRVRAPVAAAAVARLSLLLSYRCVCKARPCSSGVEASELYCGMIPSCHHRRLRSIFGHKTRSHTVMKKWWIKMHCFGSDKSKKPQKIKKLFHFVATQPQAQNCTVMWERRSPPAANESTNPPSPQPPTPPTLAPDRRHNPNPTWVAPKFCRINLFKKLKNALLVL